jgi:pimeloyl-ACP methyl ester carboxylesterase
MANFLLVHGAWHGAWCWRPVTQALVRAGHNAHAVTLTGLGERAHLLTTEITLETHISDVVNAIQMEEMSEMVLVVHSYAGMIGTAIADRMPNRIRHLVYLDAVLPKPGESWSSTHSASTRESRVAATMSSPWSTFPPPDPSVFGLAGDEYEWVKRRQVPQPGRGYEAPLNFDPRRVAVIPRTFISCMQPPLATIDVSRARAADKTFWDGAWHSRARVVEMKTGHDPMVSAPADLTRILLECAG